MAREKIYNDDEFKVIKENLNKKFVIRKEDNKFIFLNNNNVEKRNFTFSINDEDRKDETIMEFIFNQEDFNKSVHYLILNWIKEHSSENIKIDRYGNLV